MPLNGKTPDPDPDSNKSQGEASKNPLQERPVPDYLVDYLTDPTRERYEVLVGKVHRHVHLVASRILNDDLLAAEATQEVLLFLKKPRWKPEEVQKGLGLITRVTVSIARTLRRSLWRERRRKRTLDGLPEPPATKDLPLDIASIVRAAIRELEEDLRRCVIFRYYLNLETYEIAGIVKVDVRTVQDRLLRARKLLKKRLGPELAPALLPALVGPRMTPPAVSPELLARLEEIVASHPPRVGRKLASSGSSGSGTKRRRTRVPWPFVLPFTASLLLVGLIAGLLSGRASRLGGGGAPLVSKAPAPVVSRRERPIDRFAPNGRLRQIDWRPPGEEAMLDAEPVKEEDRIDCTVRVVDDDGKLVRSGVVQVLRLREPLTGEELEPGESAGDQSEKEGLLSANLAESNPASFRREGDLHGTKVLVRVKADGYPPLQKSAVELRRGRMRIEIKLRSKPVTTIHVRDALSEEPVTGARVEIHPGLEADGERRKVVTISGEEREPGEYVLRGFPQGKYDLTVESASFLPILREGIELEEELEIWAHAREKVRTGRIAVKAFGPDGKPWAETEVVARVNGALIHRTTDKEGLCRFEDLLPGSHAFLLPVESIPVTAAPFVAEKIFLVRPGCERSLTLGSPPDSAKLAVAVRDPFGAPLPDVIVRIEGPRFFVARTEWRGQAEFPRIPPGTYRLGLRGVGPEDWAFEKEIEVEPGEENRKEVKLGGAVVRGRVIAEDLSALRILASSAGRIAAVAPGSDGRFAFFDVLPGKLVLSTGSEVAGFVYKKKLVVEVPDVGDPPEVEIRLSALGTVWVVVTDGEGKPVAGTKVTSLGPQGEVELTRRSSGLRGGEFVGLLEPGPNQLKVTAPGQDPHERSINVRAGEKESVEVVLAP